MTARDPAREAVIAAFLAAAGWGTAARRPLAGDASPRRYDRLARPDGTTAVLMDADPARGEDVRPFLAIARHLAALGLSPPSVFAGDTAAGLLLLEDLGDDLLARHCARAPGDEAALYAAAVDVLVHLHRQPAPEGIAAYDPATMGTLAGLAAEWYAPAATGAATGAAASAAAGDGAAALAAATAAALSAHAGGAPVLALRDFHAENLLWLPARAGPARIGLLDFQDARAGHPAYDLVSLTEDARRDLAPGLAAACLERYRAATGRPAATFAAACAALAAQRNLRILGVFARLAIRDAKPGYVALIPRVWAHLAADLAHPALARLRRVALAVLPAPTPDRLARIVARCPPRPAR